MVAETISRASGSYPSSHMTMDLVMQLGLSTHPLRMTGCMALWASRSMTSSALARASHTIWSPSSISSRSLSLYWSER